MSWLLCRWVWRLEAPLSIGLPPSGSLNRCRLYAPARNLWGALTAEVAQRQVADFPTYAAIGMEIRQNVRFTYLFPAEPADSGWQAWLSRYEHGKGLIWGLESAPNGRRVNDRELRSRLLATRPSTAIDHASGAAAEGTLREFECLSQHWRDSATDGFKRVALVGYVFVREGAGVAGAIDMVTELALGGDTRYGLGRIHRITRTPVSDVFGDIADLSGNAPVVRTGRVLAHRRAPAHLSMVGQLEALGGWDRSTAGDLRPLAPQPLWVPGSSTTDETSWLIDEHGFWVAEARNP